MEQESLKEAYRVFQEEAAALEKAWERVQGQWNAAVDLLYACRGKVVTTGIGKSGLIARKIAATLSSTGTPSVFMNAGEALHGDLGMISSEDVVIMVTNSGATPELVRMIPSLKNRSIPILGLMGNVGTRLADDCEVVLDTGVEKEACLLNLAPTTSATVAMVTGDALAICLQKRRKFSSEDFALFHPGGNLGKRLLLRAADIMHPAGKIPIIGPDADFEAVIVTMTRFPFGAVLVCDAQGILKGIITDGDVRRSFQKDAAVRHRAESWMSKDPVAVGPDDRLGEVLEVMEKPNRKVYVVPVVDHSGKPCGLIRMHDILGGEYRS